MDEEKQRQKIYAYLGETHSRVAVGGIHVKGVDIPQAVPMVETGGAGTTYLGV